MTLFLVKTTSNTSVVLMTPCVQKQPCHMNCNLQQNIATNILSKRHHKNIKEGASMLWNAGHSLGGALASLAAFDIQRQCPCLKPLDVSCYTFGAPRVGNHAFARQYDAVVPDTWNIINNQVSQPVQYLCKHTSFRCLNHHWSGLAR